MVTHLVLKLLPAVIFLVYKEGPIIYYSHLLFLKYMASIFTQSVHASESSLIFLPNTAIFQESPLYKDNTFLKFQLSSF